MKIFVGFLGYEETRFFAFDIYVLTFRRQLEINGQECRRYVQPLCVLPRPTFVTNIMALSLDSRYTRHLLVVRFVNTYVVKTPVQKLSNLPSL